MSAAPKREAAPEGTLLTPRDLRRRLRCSYHHVLALLHEGAIPVYDVGLGSTPRYRVQEADVKAFLEQRSR